MGSYRTPDRIYPGDTIVTNGDLAQRVIEVVRNQDVFTLSTTLGILTCTPKSMVLVIARGSGVAP